MEMPITVIITLFVAVVVGVVIINLASDMITDSRDKLDAWNDEDVDDEKIIELDTVLRQYGIKTVILTGVATNVCVESTARDAFAMDYYVVLLSDCTGTFSSQLQELTLLNVNQVFGTVCTSDEIVATWENR